MISFVNEEKVASKRHPGYCYLLAGFRVRVSEVFAQS